MGYTLLFLLFFDFYLFLSEELLRTRCYNILLFILIIIADWISVFFNAVPDPHVAAIFPELHFGMLVGTELLG